MPWHIKRLENGLLVQAYDQKPDDESEELLTPEGRTQDECHPRFAHLKLGESMVLPDEPKTTTSSSWYPNQYEELSEFLNGDPGAIVDRHWQQIALKRSQKSPVHPMHTRVKWRSLQHRK